MIVTNSRDLLTLFHDLAVGWVSGQETTWIDERIGPNDVAYNCLLTGRWDHRAMQIEGQRLAGLMRVSPIFANWRTFENGTGVHSYNLGSYVRLDILRKGSGSVTYHVYVPEIEFPRSFFQLLVSLDEIFNSEKVGYLAPVAFHITRLNFSRTTMPFLLPILGRRAFFDVELSETLNKDLDNLKTILSPDYRNKKKQAVWALVKKHMGNEEVY